MLREDPTNGYAVPFQDIDDDALTECVEALDDPEAGPPEGWPGWVDEDRWQLGIDPAPQPDSEAEYDASQRGDEPYTPTAEDLAEYSDWCERVEYERSMNAKFV